MWWWNNFNVKMFCVEYWCNGSKNFDFIGVVVVVIDVINVSWVMDIL